jgi:hypothetical protein
MTPRGKLDPSMFFDGCWMFLAIIITGVIIVGFFSLAYAQHIHPPQDEALHYQFYNTWLQPNGKNPRQRSCCNKLDCYPTSIRLRGGHWEGRRREDGKWVTIPNEYLEELQDDPRESPDGQSHMCAARPNPFSGDIVFCAVRGSAI